MSEEFTGFHPQVAPSSEKVAGTDLEQELATCRQELRDIRRELDTEREVRQRDRDQLMRQLADVDNARKRSERTATERGTADRRRILRAILPVVDNLERALAERPGDLAALRHGLDIVRRQFDDTLKSLGAVRLAAQDAPFDPQRHEAVATEASIEKAGRVIREMEAGYMLDGELLRPARVIVGQNPEQGKATPGQGKAAAGPVEQPGGVSEPVEGP